MDDLSYSPRESAAPLRFGRYEVLFRIAAGGMAEVYAARMVGEGGFEKPVAVKRMLPQLAEDERFVQMFLDEGRLAAHISSPHVVQTLDLGRADDDSLYLVMELVVGVSLSALVRALLRKKQQIPVAAVVDILAQAAEGLHDAHEARTMYGQPLEIVHRDVSPQNILVDVSGRVRITDFGVARALERATHTQSGEVKGKIGYFAPEQVKGKSVDRRTDVFALGIVAWETLAGRRLFAGDNPAQTLDYVMSMPIPPLDALRADVPPALAHAIAHALERDMDLRTATAGDFADELRRALRPAGAATVSAIVREHGGESLMKLEDGLRAQSPSSLSRVRKAQGPAGASLSSAGGQVAPRSSSEALSSVPSDPHATREIVSPDQAPTRPELTAAAAPGQAVTAILLAPEAQPAPGSGSSALGAPDPFASPLPIVSDDAPAPRSRAWVLGAAVAAIGLLAAVGIGATVALQRDTPEPTTVALPPATPAAPAPAALAAPTSQPPAAVTPTEPAEPVEPVAAPSPGEPAAPLAPRPRTGVVRRDRDPRPDPEEATLAARPAASERERPAVREPERPAREPERPATGRASSGTGSAGTSSAGTSMRTGLVGLGEFEDEIGQ